MGKPKKEQNKNIETHIFKHIQFAEDSLPNLNRRRNRKSPKNKNKFILRLNNLWCAFME
jgi:hypothetical protein